MHQPKYVRDLTGPLDLALVDRFGAAWLMNGRGGVTQDGDPSASRHSRTHVDDTQGMIPA